ncbi:MAG: LysR family transcriptional regulator substrate-binding protein [Oribacterium sp.]|nr:LysR family transcriptional regulator substrate-binding protein [Oribacterium sp.]MDY6317574.1 LysR family transcriptional regulator substrate-binding protein [Oribacterium sp.]
MFQHIFPIFHAIYPHIYFKIHEARNIGMEELLEKREVDIVCTTYDAGRRNPSFTYIAGVKEEYLLGIPETNPALKLFQETLPKQLAVKGSMQTQGEKSSEDSAVDYPVFDITLLKDQEFILGNAETRSHTFEMDIFAYASMTPKVLFETSSSGTKLAMMQKQIAPAFLPQAYTNKDDPIRYFRCPPYPSWTTCVATRRDDYLTVPELVLADLIRRYNQNEVGMKTKKLLMR